MGSKLTNEERVSIVWICTPAPHISCKGGCISASCFLQPPRNGLTGQVPVLEHETFCRTLLNFQKDCPRNTSYMYEVFLGQ